MAIPETLNQDYIDQQYRLWKEDPSAVSRDWRFFFEGYEIASGEGPTAKTVSPEAEKPEAEAPKPEPARRTQEGAPPESALMPEDACTLDKALLQSRVEALKYRYRDLGHLLACLDPLAACPTSHPLLDLSAFGLSNDDLETEFYTRRFSETRSAKLKDIIADLKRTYCRSVGVEYMHLQDPQERRWLQDRMESVHNQPDLSRDEKLRILNKLYQSALFENYLHKKYMGQTRFSLEGGDALIPVIDALLLRASDAGLKEVILGMAHRGRLNVLTNILFKPYEEIFREFINSYDPNSLVGAGDVKYHNGYMDDIKLANGKSLRIFMVNNPSHLESVDPVVEGVAFARQDMLENGARNVVLPLLIHGDAAFAGQGVVMETLNLSQLEGYKTEGTLHIIINNQIGYTTLPENARSTRYSTDVAKMLMVPVFHVHGENPEAVVHVVRLAHDYRIEFKKDVVIDLVCYRRFGHNEGDEPYFTQPTMYDRIKERPPVYELYRDRLADEGVIGESDAEPIGKGINECLETAFQEAQNNPRVFPDQIYFEEWRDYNGDFSHEIVETGVNADTLLDIGRKLTAFPDDFKPHSKLKRLFGKRAEALESRSGIDWANAESLAFGSLLAEGAFVRLSGQDSARGTFSQRHAVIVNRKTGEPYSPYDQVVARGATFEVHNSSLSEAGVLGFEYGYAIVRPNGLTIWEAQFGDFANNAQGIIDLYIASGETKWRRLSGLVMLLPHGWEGLGPEHSSARLERFLQLCAHDNIQVCNLTTPAQYFHLLRRQVKASWRKPLVLMTPKSMLRMPQAVSDLEELATGHFMEVIPDRREIEKPKRVLFCSGKIYYQILQRRDTLKANNMAIVRVEQLYPFPQTALEEIVERYKTADTWFWVQEGPKNMEAWSYMEPRLRRLTGKEIQYVGRDESASPATGFSNIYKQEQGAIPDDAIGQLSGVQVG